MIPTDQIKKTAFIEPGDYYNTDDIVTVKEIK